MLVKLLDEKRPPFVEGPDGVVCRLDFSYISGSDEVEKEVGSKNWCFCPLCDVEKREGKWCNMVGEFFAVGNGGYCLLEVGLVVDGSWFGG